MSEANNPLFDNQRDFLERQKEEYKKALMGDVEQIKTQSQEIGKKVAIAGGILVAGLLLRRMFGGSKKKSKKLKKAASPLQISHSNSSEVSSSVVNYNSLLHEQEDGYTVSSERMHHHVQARQPESTAIAKGFLSSELAQMITHQLAALLMVYITKKVEEYLKSIPNNNDIATQQPIEVTEIETTEYIYPEKDAL
ncbi:hypothetical protein [Pontibacter sp. SGAir0037]|uniref:hypothetical protein n=1 Tax=Pontibacter sp. SGAir0037 TaxID=2571030 RepID=UPI0010CCB75D|nr:hypothetical protein [Pontibacter sp. SGAir0037]QCR24062.1 hypothetical protein C1N53_18000 [Pontibacter sp. SGAir0037]